jgi:hypothetical protein
MDVTQLQQIQIPALKDIPAVTAPVLHLLIALWGLVDCLFGLKIFTATVKILMAFAFAAGAATLSLQFYPESVAWLAGAAIGGLIIGLLLGWYLYKIGVALSAVFAGFVLSAPLAAMCPPEYAMFVQGAVALVAGIVAFFIMEPAIIVSTALTGAFRLVFGLAFFFWHGPSLLDYMGGKKPLMELFTGQNQTFALATLGAAAVGCFIQFRAWRAAHKGKDEESD